MKKIIYPVLALMLLGIGIAGYLYFKGTTDYSNQDPDYTVTQTSLIQQVDGDTTSLMAMQNKLVLIQEGKIKSIDKEGKLHVIELCPSNEGSSITCQIDPRHNDDIKSLQVGQQIAIKGILTDFNIDTELNLGNTIQMNYCIVTTPKQ